MESLHQALRNVLAEDEISAITTRLRDIRADLTLRVLVKLRKNDAAQAVRNDERLGSLETYLQTIICTILDGNSEMTEKIDQSTQIFTQLQMNHYDEIMTAISALSGPTQTTSQRITVEVLADLAAGRAALTERFILQSLAFRDLRAREESIDPAHASTFQWTLREDSQENVKWSNFAQWLLAGDGIYWIRGKAASGKSTLMRFLTEAPETKDMLRKWAGNSRLHVASFYFWHLGTKLQKSQVGLLRSLLLSLCLRNESLIKTSMPGYYNEISRVIDPSGQASGVETLSTNEVKLAFLRLVTNLPKDLHICLFIDGLDEYEGHVSEILSLLVPITFKRLKLVISSRPTLYCKAALDPYPQLRLEDLTIEDILRYVREKIQPHPHAKTLDEINPEKNEVNTVVEEVGAKSRGVFLWVVLVVRLLLHSLDTGDNIEELQKQLNAFPPELEDFYRHMMDSMELSHREQASWYLQLVLRSIEVQIHHPLNLIQRCLAEECGETKDIRLITPRDRIGWITTWNARQQAMETRLTGRCCGLLEAMTEPVTTERPSRTVSFIHKSVADFLKLETTAAYIKDLASSVKMELNYVLAKSCVAYLTTISSISPIRIPYTACTEYCLLYLRAGEVRTGRLLSSVIGEVRRFCQLRSGQEIPGKNYDILSEGIYAGRWPRSASKNAEQGYDPEKHGLLPPTGLRLLSDTQADLCIAACSTLPLHFQSLMAQRHKSAPSTSAPEIGHSLLLCVLLQQKRLDMVLRWTSLQDHFTIIAELVTNGTDPNMEFQRKSAWQILLTLIYTYMHYVPAPYQE